MTAGKETHVQHARPRMAARDLADHMAASEVSKRAVVRNGKFEQVPHVTHRDEARAVVAKFVADRDTGLSWLAEEAQRIRGRAGGLRTRPRREQRRLHRALRQGVAPPPKAAL